MSLTISTHYPNPKLNPMFSNPMANVIRCNGIVGKITKNGNGIKISAANKHHAKFTSNDLVGVSGCPMTELHGEISSTQHGTHTALGFHFESDNATIYADNLNLKLIHEIIDRDHKGIKLINEKLTEPKKQEGKNWYNIQIEFNPNVTDDEIVIIAIDGLNILTSLIKDYNLHK